MIHRRLEFPRIFPTELHTLKIDSLKKKHVFFKLNGTVSHHFSFYFLEANH